MTHPACKNGLGIKPSPSVERTETWSTPPFHAVATCRVLLPAPAWNWPCYREGHRIVLPAIAPSYFATPLTAGFAANADYASLIRPTTGIRLRARNGGGAVLKRQRNYCGKKALLGGEHWDLTGEGSTAKAAIGDDGLRLAVGVAVGRNQATGPCRPWQTNRARGHKSECPAPRCG